MHKKNPPNHVALIMDGNDRWAKQNSVTRDEGHKAGAENAFNVIKYAAEAGIKHLSLFAFSTENWNRPKEEVDSLMNLFGLYAIKKIDDVKKQGVKVKFVGDLSRLSIDLQNTFNKIEELSKNNSVLTLYMVISYGSKSEIVNAVKKIITNKIPSEELSENTFAQFLYCPEMPDVDLLIRTSNVSRLSNFLLWQCAYAELYFIEKLWPDFNKEDFQVAILEYQNRKRRFGLRDV